MTFKPVTETRPDLSCERCYRGGIVEGKAADGRPEYRCTMCGNAWTRGHAGEPVRKKARR